MNYLSMLNELLATVISYFIIQINNPAHGPEVNVKIGQIVVYLIYASWTCNGVFITYMSVQEIYGNVKNFYLRKFRR